MSNAPLPYITLPQDINPDRATVVAQIIANLQQVVASAETDLVDPTLSREQLATARMVIAEAQSAITVWQQDGTAAISPSQVTIQSFDTIPLIAQQTLGSPLRYRDILALNSRTGWAVNQGDVLKVPLS